MTSYERRALKSRGLDPDTVEQQRIAAREMRTVTYELDDLGQPVIPEDQPDRAIAIEVAAALDKVINGQLTGTVIVPQSVLDRCTREAIAHGMRTLRNDQRSGRLSATARMMLMAAAMMPEAEIPRRIKP